MSDQIFTVANLPPRRPLHARLRTAVGKGKWTRCYQVLVDCKFQIGIAVFTVRSGDYLITGKDCGVARAAEFHRLYKEDMR